MRNFQGMFFIWTETYSELFKSALLYLSDKNTPTKMRYIWILFEIEDFFTI